MVPYILSVKPQENGDVIVEIYHFTHDSSEIPLSTLAEPSSAASAAHTRSTPTASLNASELLEDPLLAASRQAQHLRTGYFSTSYNRMMTSITALGNTGERIPKGADLLVREGKGDDRDGDGGGTRAKARRRGTAGKGRDDLLEGARDNGSSNAGYQHLLVREDEQRKLLEEILADHPTGTYPSPSLPHLLAWPYTLLPRTSGRHGSISHCKQSTRLYYCGQSHYSKAWGGAIYPLAWPTESWLEALRQSQHVRCRRGYSCSISASSPYV